MERLSLRLTVLVGVLFALVSCNWSPGSHKPARELDDPEAVAFLKKSMDVYAKLPALQASYKYSVFSGESTITKQDRDFSYSQPNLFKVTSTNEVGFIQTSICDGKSEIEYSSIAAERPIRNSVPSSIADVDSMQMVQPLFCGSLLYLFFGGSANYSKLVDSSKGPVTFGGLQEMANGDLGKLVQFTGPKGYGNVEVMISDTTGLVYRIRYDGTIQPEGVSNAGEETRQIKKTAEAKLAAASDDYTKKRLQEAIAKIIEAKEKSVTSEELYDNVDTPTRLPAALFDTNAPKGSKPIDLAGAKAASAKPPFPIGSMARDFSVTGADGNPVTLSSLAGHPLLIIFWATWCDPSIKALALAEEALRQGAMQGLQVMAISDEDSTVISGYLASHPHTISTYSDPKQEAVKKYRATALPTAALVGSDGKLLAYVRGDSQPNGIRDALATIGIRL